MEDPAFERWNTHFSNVVEQEVFGTTLKLCQNPNSEHLGTTVWDASIVMAKYLEKNVRKGDFARSRARGKRGIELGAGMGLGGLALAMVGVDVVLTDVGEVLPMLQRNYELNLSPSAIRLHGKDTGWAGAVGKVTVQELDWSNWDHIKQANGPYHYILAADCIYHEYLLEHLYNTIMSLTDDKSTVLIANELRSQSVQSRFINLFAKSFTIKRVAPKNMHPMYQHTLIELYILRRRKGAVQLDSTAVAQLLREPALPSPQLPAADSLDPDHNEADDGQESPSGNSAVPRAAEAPPASCTAADCTAADCTAADCTAADCIAADCAAANCTAADCTAADCTAADCIAADCVAADCTAAECTAADCTAADCIAADCVAADCTAADCITADCAAADCTAAGCTAADRTAADASSISTCTPLGTRDGSTAPMGHINDQHPEALPCSRELTKSYDLEGVRHRDRDVDGNHTRPCGTSVLHNCSNPAHTSVACNVTNECDLHIGTPVIQRGSTSCTADNPANQEHAGCTGSTSTGSTSTGSTCTALPVATGSRHRSAPHVHDSSPMVASSEMTKEVTKAAGSYLAAVLSKAASGPKSTRTETPAAVQTVQQAVRETVQPGSTQVRDEQYIVGGSRNHVPQNCDAQKCDTQRCDAQKCDTQRCNAQKSDEAVDQQQQCTGLSAAVHSGNSWAQRIRTHPNEQHANLNGAHHSNGSQQDRQHVTGNRPHHGNRSRQKHQHATVNRAHHSNELQQEHEHVRQDNGCQRQYASQRSSALQKQPQQASDTHTSQTAAIHTPQTAGMPSQKTAGVHHDSAPGQVSIEATGHSKSTQIYEQEGGVIGRAGKMECSVANGSHHVGSTSHGADDLGSSSHGASDLGSTSHGASGLGSTSHSAGISSNASHDAANEGDVSHSGDCVLRGGCSTTHDVRSTVHGSSSTPDVQQPSNVPAWTTAPVSQPGVKKGEEERAAVLAGKTVAGVNGSYLGALLASKLSAKLDNSPSTGAATGRVLPAARVAAAPAATGQGPGGHMPDEQQRWGTRRDGITLARLMADVKVPRT